MCGELRERVSQTVEDAPERSFRGGADDLVKADRKAYRAGCCGRELVVATGRVALKTPKLKA